MGLHFTPEEKTHNQSRRLPGFMSLKTGWSICRMPAALVNSKLTIRFLTGIGKLKDDFNVKYAAEPVDSDGNYRLELVPKTREAGAGFERLVSHGGQRYLSYNQVCFQ